jgi:hypothetical protein
MELPREYATISKLLRDHSVEYKAMLDSVMQVTKGISQPDISKAIRQLLDGPSGIASINGNIVSAIRAIDPVGLNSMSKGILSISHLGSSASLESFARQALKADDLWRKSLGLTSFASETLASAHLTLHSRFIDVSQLATYAGATLAHTNWSNIATFFPTSGKIASSVESSVMKAADSFSELFGSLEHSPIGFLQKPPLLTLYPPIEIFQIGRLSDVVSNKEPLDIEDAASVIGDAESEIRDSFVDLLGKVDKKLIRLWNGALQSMTSANPDRVRHFAVSLRELQTHVLHVLAPSEKVRAWSTSPEHYHEGKPTRRARLLYICRTLAHEPFEKFVEDDVKSHIAFLQLFQEGTHSLDIPFRESDLMALKARTESLLRFVIEISLMCEVS